MTIHSAKGLEFPVVMVAGLEEGLFPLSASSFEIEELEEERRLFYVALTRAEKKVYLSYAQSRRRFGGVPIPCVQSRFIHELPNNLIDYNYKQSSYSKEYHDSNKQVSHNYRSSNASYNIGAQVEHKLFGRGKILAVEGVGDTAKLTVLFSGNVRKKLISKYANLIHIQY
jgi:DNA helicase-2/ATP-dependent DNA helicase PcrA